MDTDKRINKDAFDFAKNALYYLTSDANYDKLINAVYLGWNHNVAVIEQTNQNTENLQEEIQRHIRLNNSMIIISDDTDALQLVKEHQYCVKYLDLENMENTLSSYNPIAYINGDIDIQYLAHQIIYWTTSEEKRNNNDYTWWETAENYLLCVLIGIIYRCYPEPLQTMGTVKALLNNIILQEHDAYKQQELGMETSESKLDTIVDKIKSGDADCDIVKFYDVFCKIAGNHRISIMISAAIRLQIWDLQNVRQITDTDSMYLTQIADKKTAIFIYKKPDCDVFDIIWHLLVSQAEKLIITEYVKNRHSFC